jgi:hypothetical protein
MKEAAWRATSETLAHMLAVMAMLVIASVLFYSGSHRSSLDPHGSYPKLEQKPG